MQVVNIIDSDTESNETRRDYPNSFECSFTLYFVTQNCGLAEIPMISQSPQAIDILAAFPVKQGNQQQCCREAISVRELHSSAVTGTRRHTYRMLILARALLAFSFYAKKLVPLTKII